MKTTVLLACAFLLAVPAWAQYYDQGQPVSISTCTVISKPGSYVLTKNITARAIDLKRIGAGEPGCILIVADFVTLDLKGYTIKGPGLNPYFGSGFGIYITGNASGIGPVAVHVRNGSVSNFDRGIDVEGGTDHTVEGMRAVRNGTGVFVSSDGIGGIRVRDVVASFNTWMGILLWAGPGNSVEDCQANSNSDSGIFMMNWEGAALGSRIVGSTAAGNGNQGIVALCPSLILQNMAYSNPGGNIVANPGCNTMSDNNPAP